MLAPARLWTSVSPVRSRIDAVIAALVVLPFVALITALPCARRCPSSPIACGSRRVSTLPGSDVPPPRRTARTIVPTAFAAATLGPRRVTGREP
jgi:hypothetical protein